jgi:hypothetical protein
MPKTLQIDNGMRVIFHLLSDRHTTETHRFDNGREF